MADLSLDAYIAKTSQGNRTMRGGLGSRLGAKVGRGASRGRGGTGRGRGNFSQSAPSGGQQNARANPQFNVVGLGKVRGFDARQKLSNPLKTAVQDAREKIRSKTFDARRAIETKKEQKQGLDVRNKIEENKARKVDARQKLNIARQGKTQNTDQKVTVTGGFRKITPPGANPHAQDLISMTQGSLTKTIRSAPAIRSAPTIRSAPLQQKQPMAPLTRTVDNSQTRVPQPQSPHSAVRSMQMRTPVMRSPPPPTNNLVITKRNTAVTRPTQHPPPSSRSTISLRGIRSQSSEQWTGTESTLRSAVGTGTMVSVKNDMYHPHRRMDDGDGPDYPHPAPRTTSSQPPVQPSTVWQAIQSATTKRTPDTHVPLTDTVSPLQGYRVLVTNLHHIVSQDDIIELFGAVGALKKARLIKPGTAEVVFVTKEEAHAAVNKYHLRELDGLPMQLVLTTRGGGPDAGAAAATQRPVTPQRPITTQPNPNPQAPPAPGGPLRLAQLEQANGKQSSMTVDPNLIHKALFKTVSRDEGPVRPVTFTVKI